MPRQQVPRHRDSQELPLLHAEKQRLRARLVAGDKKQVACRSWDIIATLQFDDEDEDVDDDDEGVDLVF